LTHLEQLLPKRADRISAERNIEKWPAIWQTAKAHLNPEARHFEREIEWLMVDE